MTSTLIPKVSSLRELRELAERDPRYLRLTFAAAHNLGGRAETFETAMRWLSLNADETSEDGVIAEINYCRDLV